MVAVNGRGDSIGGIAAARKSARIHDLVCSGTGTGTGTGSNTDPPCYVLDGGRTRQHSLRAAPNAARNTGITTVEHGPGRPA
ncbi:hypothetical protein [Streptomyces sp. NPDC057199]|uniref:hypothetical protein n=1 Tax=Streptomyces sp. NPDC057199 TaxID=3346047 RepID=UPI00363A8092